MANRYASILANPMVEQVLACETRNSGAHMYILIDTTNGAALARHESMHALQALHYIQFTNVDAAIIPEGANRGWAQLNAMALRGVLASVGYTGIQPTAYAQLIAAARQATEACAWLLLPYTRDALVAQAYSISPHDSRPMRFAPGAAQPAVATAWPTPPAVRITRAESTFALQFSAGTGEVIQPVPLTSHSRGATLHTPTMGSHTGEKQMAAKTKKAPAAPKAPKPKKVTARPAKAPAAPKPPKAPKTAAGQREIHAPREGGVTRKVWDVCEALLASRGTCPPFSAVLDKLGDSVGIATQRSTYAYWRRGRGFTGRVTE